MTSTIGNSFENVGDWDKRDNCGIQHQALILQLSHRWDVLFKLQWDRLFVGFSLFSFLLVEGYQMFGKLPCKATSGGIEIF